MKPDVIMNNTILNTIYKKYREAAVEAGKDCGGLKTERLMIIAKLYYDLWNTIRNDDVEPEIVDAYMTLHVHRLLLEQRKLKEQGYDPAIPLEVFDIICNDLFNEIMKESNFH